MGRLEQRGSCPEHFLEVGPFLIPSLGAPGEPRGQSEACWACHSDGQAKASLPSETLDPSSPAARSLLNQPLPLLNSSASDLSAFPHASLVQKQ